MCLDTSVNVGASETGVITCTDGSAEAHETPWIVVDVGLPAPSFSVTVMLNGAPPGQVTGTHASVLIAVTAAVPTQLADPPSDTHKLFTAGPSDAGRLAASVADVRPQTLNALFVSCPGPKNWPSVGCVTVRSGGVVSTGKLVSGELPLIPARFLHFAITW